MKRVGYVVLAVVMLAGCGTQKRTIGVEHSLRPTLENELVYEDTPFYNYTQGVEMLYLHDEADSALRLFERAISLDSLHAPSYYEAANAAARFDYDKAIEYSRRANDLDTTDFWHKTQLGRLLIMVEQYDQAQKLYEQLIELSPRTVENYSMLAALYEHDNQPFSAIAILERAEVLNGKVEELMAQKKELLIKVKLYDKAIDEGQQMVDNYPFNYENYLSLGQLYAQTKKDSLAMVNFKMAEELNPNGLDVLGTVSEYYRGIKDSNNYLATVKKVFQHDELPLETKVTIFEEITANRAFYESNYFYIKDLASTLYVKYPREYQVMDLYAGNMLAWGDREGAVELFKEYVRDNDTLSFTTPYTEIISIEAVMERADSVKKYIGIATKRFPRDSDLYMQIGWALSYMKDDKATAKAYEQAYKYAENDSLRSVHKGAIGDMHYQAGRAKKGYAAYEKAIELWGDNVMVLNNYAYYLSEENKELEKALEMSARVAELEPRNATYIDTYAWILYKLGRYEQARKAMQQAIALDTRNSKVLLVHYGDILFALGDYYMATVYWTRALEAGYDKEEIEQRLKQPKP